MLSIQTVTIFLVLLTATTVPAVRVIRSSDASTTALNSENFKWIQYYSTDMTRDACNAKYNNPSTVETSSDLTDCSESCDELDWCTSFVYCHGNCTLPVAVEGRCELRGDGCSDNTDNPYTIAECPEEGWCTYISNSAYDPRMTSMEDVRSDEHRDDDRDVRSDEHRDDDRDVRSDEHRDDLRDVRSDEHRDDVRDVRSDEHRDDDRDVRSDEHRNYVDPRSPEHIPVSADAPASAAYDPRDQLVIAADYDPRDNYTHAADYDPRDPAMHSNPDYDPRDPAVHAPDANYDPRDQDLMAADYDPRDFANFTL